MRTRKIILGDYCCDAISAVMVIYSYIKEIEDRMHIKRSKKGFTLAELLIVVAIIGVLVAISIPIFSGQLEKAREATDAANIRSQYAEVLADAMMGGSVNKDHKDYAPVQLRQQKDEWQSDGLKASLKGVFGKVTGTGPKAAGQAWVEFDAARNVAVLHYDDGSGSSGSESAGSGAEGGGGTVAPAPTNPTKPIEPTSPTEPTRPPEPETTPTKPTEPETKAPGQTPDGSGTESGNKPETNEGADGSKPEVMAVLDISTAKEYPVKPLENQTLQIKKGERYKYNGQLYIVAATPNKPEYNQYDYVTPETATWLFAKPTGRILSSSNSVEKELRSLKRGDIYQTDDGNSYIRCWDSDPGLGPSYDTANWCLINP